MRRWLPLLALLSLTAGYVAAEDITLTTYYPSPRGVYEALRVGKKVADNATAAFSVNAPNDATRPTLMQVDNPKDASRPMRVMLSPSDNQLHLLVNATAIPATLPAVYAIGAMEADAFRAFQANGRYAFIEAGALGGTVKMGGFNLAPPAYVPTQLDGNPLYFNPSSGGGVMIGSFVFPNHKLDVNGNMAVGTGALGFAAPTNGVLVQGDVQLMNGAKVQTPQLCLGGVCRLDWPGNVGGGILQASPCPVGKYAAGVDFTTQQVLCRSF